MAQQFFAIARNTFVESIRQPVFIVLLFVGTAMLVINLNLSAYTMEDDNFLLIDMSFGVVFLVPLVLAAFTATGVLSEEIENRTVLTVVSKPVSRPLFVAGKFFGVAAAITVAFYLLSIIFVLTLRHEVLQTVREKIDWPVISFSLIAVIGALLLATLGNYFYRWVFTSTLVYGLVIGLTAAMLGASVVGKGWVFQSPLTDLTAEHGRMWQVVVGLALLLQAVLVITAVAVAASTRLGQIMTLMFCLGVFLLGRSRHAVRTPDTESA